MTLEFKDFNMLASRTSELTEARKEGFIPDPVLGICHGVEGMLIYHLIKGTPEEIEEYANKARPKVEVSKTPDIKTLIMYNAKEMKQYDPRKDLIFIDGMKKSVPEGYEWIVSDKWKELIEYSLVPKNVAELVRQLSTPSTEFDPVSFLKKLPNADLKKLMETVKILVDPLTQELLKKAVEEPPAQPAQPQSSPAG